MFCKLEENNTEIQTTAFNRQLTEFSKYRKLNREATVYRKFSLKDWFAAKHYPEQILWIQCDAKRSESSSMIFQHTATIIKHCDHNYEVSSSIHM